MADQKELKIYLLGSARLTWNEKPLLVARRQVRALLYRLAASLKPVSRESIYALLWSEKPDVTARRNLSRLLVYLRQALPDPDLIRATSESIVLDHEKIWCDLHIFLGVETNDPEQILENSLKLYSGRFLDGFYLPNNLPYEDWLFDIQRGVEEKQMVVVDELIRRKMAARDYDAAIRLTHQKLKHDVLDEAVHRQLMTLYHQIGDRRAVQRQYEECVTVLEKELGVDPLPETYAAYQSALQKKPIPSADYPIPKWAVLPSLDLPLIGRETAWKQLEGAHQRLRSGGIILINGEAGMGKSRLMQAFASQSQVNVITGNAFAATQTVPYGPLLAALRTMLAQPDWLSEVPMNWLSEAQLLLPELCTTFPDLPPPFPMEQSQARGRHYEAMTQIFVGLAKRAPLWLCLDDLHWADGDTLDWLGYLLERLPGNDLFVIATRRKPDPGRQENKLAEMRRSKYFEEITLESLDEQAIVDLLRSLPEPIKSTAFAKHLFRVSGGNPFFLLEIIRTILENGQTELSIENLPLPSSVRDVIKNRLQLISPLASQILESAAILETDLQPVLMQTVSGRQEDEINTGLIELVDQQLLRSEGETIEFQHSLIQLTILDGLHFWRQKVLHRRAAQALSIHFNSYPARIAHHWEAAGEWKEAAEAYASACQYLADQYAYPAAMSQVERGLRVLGNVLDPEPFRLKFLILRMKLNQIQLNLEAWQGDMELVDRLATRLNDNEARLATLESRLSWLTLQSDLPSLKETAEESLALAEKIGDSRAEAGIRNIWGWHLSDVAGQPSEGLPHLKKAVELAEDRDDQQLLYQSLCNLAFCERVLGSCGNALSIARYALSIVQLSDETHPSQADALREIAEAAGYLARWQEARFAMRQVVQLYEEIEDPWALGTALYNLGLFTSAMGQNMESIDAMKRVVQLGVDVGIAPDSEYGIIHRMGLAKVLLDSGNMETATEIFESQKLAETITGRARVDFANVGGWIAFKNNDVTKALQILDPIVSEIQINQTSHFLWTLLIHAQVSKEIGDMDGALKSLKKAETVFGKGDCIRLIRWLHFTRYLVLDDKEALISANNEVKRQADMFTDRDLRVDFLEQAALNREIAAALKRTI